MAYTHIQFIGYKINTFPNTDSSSKSTVIVKGHTLPLFKQTKRYRGRPDEASDVADRHILMREAIHRAATDTDKSPTTLKVFVAPEFYFRGSNGAYDFEAYSSLVDKLTSMVKKDRWKDWLFVFGSILVGYATDTSSKRQIQNVVLVQKGGVDGATRAIVKEHLSGIDFVKAGTSTVKTSSGPAVVDTTLSSGLGGTGVAHPAPSKSGGRGRELQKWDYDGRGLFMQDDICFGVEICLDHLEQRLRTSPPARNHAYVQVQLIPSAGMNIKNPSVVAVLDGLVFNCDGNPERRSELRKVTQECTRGTDAVTSAPIATETTVIAHADRGKTLLGELYADQEEVEMSIFPKQAVPPARNSTGWFRAQY